MPSLRSRLFRFFIKALFAPLPNQSIEGMRKLTEGSSFAPLTTGVHLDTQWVIGGVPTERLTVTNTARHILYLHGGGFTTGSPRTHRALVARLCLACQASATVVEYRLAPEFPFPAALNDCVRAYLSLLEVGMKTQDIFIMGDSAGGNLVLTTLLKLREDGAPLPAAAVCLSPVTDLAMTAATFQSKANVEIMFKPAMAQRMYPMYYGTLDPKYPLISPLYGDLQGLPSLLIQVGTEEILLDDAVRFAERACAVGVDVTLEVWQQMWHVWQIFAPFMPEAQQAIDAIGAFVRRVSDDNPAT
jgi:acetyl esterase/lipase